MIITIDNISDEMFMSVQDRFSTEKYELDITVCPNPVCTCGAVYLDLFPTQAADSNEEERFSGRIEIDLTKRSLSSKFKKECSRESLKFAKLVVKQLDEDDYEFLGNAHSRLKNKISEAASPDSIDAEFDYYRVETEGLMYAYNDILPYGDYLHFMMEGKEYTIFDQYCLLPKCPCQDTSIDIDYKDEVKNKEITAGSFSLDYKKKKWELRERYSPFVLSDIISTIENQIPDIYQRLHKRHSKVKKIYGFCKKKGNPRPDQYNPVPKINRNDPCPCGSGKKYKKCCLQKE